MSKTNSQNNLITGLVIGSTVGALAGLLLAPSKGKDTRNLVKKTLNALPELAEDLTSTTQRRGGKWSKQLKGRLDQSFNRLQKAIAAGIEATQLQDEPLPSQSKVNSETSAKITVE